MFIVLTGENWNEVMILVISNKRSFTPAYLFTSMMLLGNFMLLNLFLAILLKSISDIGEEDENGETFDSGNTLRPDQRVRPNDDIHLLDVVIRLQGSEQSFKRKRHFQNRILRTFRCSSRLHRSLWKQKVDRVVYRNPSLPGTKSHRARVGREVQDRKRDHIDWVHELDHISGNSHWIRL